MDNETVRCEVCGRSIALSAWAVHELMHERTGEAAAHRAAAERERERDRLRREYEESLQADRAREAAEAEVARRLAREEAAAREAEAAAAAAARHAGERARLRAEAREDRRRSAASLLAPEPPAGAPRTATLRLVLPSGTSVLRRFPRDAPMSEVFLWATPLNTVACLGDEAGGTGETGDDLEWELIPPPGLGIEGRIYPSGESIEEMQLAPDSTLRLRHSF